MLGEVDVLDVVPVTGQDGLADVRLPCSVTGDPQVSWLPARMVDRRVAQLHLDQPTPGLPPRRVHLAVHVLRLDWYVVEVGIAA